MGPGTNRFVSAKGEFWSVAGFEIRRPVPVLSLTIMSSLRVISHSSCCSVPKALQAQAVSRRSGFDPTVQIMVTKVAPRQDFLKSQPFYPVTIIPWVLHIFVSFICHRRFIILTADSAFMQDTSVTPFFAEFVSRICTLLLQLLQNYFVAELLTVNSHSLFCT